MKKNIEKVVKQIESGKRKNLYDIHFSLEDYFTDMGGITFLEYLLKNKIDLNFLDADNFSNSIEAMYLYAKYDGLYFGFKINEDELFSIYNGERYIDFFLRKNKFLYDVIKSIKNHVEIIDLLINSSNIYLLNRLNEELVEKLMIKDKEGNYLIEKYLDNESVIKELIKKVNNPLELINLCNKTNRKYLLKNANSNVLMYKIEENTTLLEKMLNDNMEPNDLLHIPANKKFINFIIEKKLYKYLKNAKEDALLITVEENTTLLEKLIEKNITPNFNFCIYENKTIEILDKNNMLNLVTNCYKKLLLTRVNEIFKDKQILKKTSLLEYMLNKGYNPLSNSYGVDNEEIIKIYYNKGYYQFLGDKLDSKNLLMNLDDGKVLIDVLLENKCDITFNGRGFTEEEIAKKLFSKQRYDLLMHGKISVLLKNAYDKNTYLDFVLECIKSKKLKCNLNNILIENCPVNLIANFYLAVARKSMIEYVETLEEEDLLKKYDGKMLIDELLDLDSELTMNTIIKKNVKSKMKIAVILKSRGLDLETVGVPLKKDNYTEDYLNNHQNSLGIGPLFDEGEILLEKLFELFVSDGKSDISLVKALVNGYRNALLLNYQQSIIELKNLIDIKEKNMEKFLYVKEENGAYFSHYLGGVHCDSAVIETLLHETGHALHSYLTGYSIPDEYKSIVKRVRQNPQTLQGVEKFSNIYNDMKKRMKKIAEEKYHEFFKTNFNSEYINSIEQFIKKTKTEKREEFESLGIDNETLDTILDNIFTSEEYIAHQKKVFINEYSDHMMRSEFGSLMAVGDILDAIYDGQLNSGVLKNENGEKIKRTAGHGISYYYNYRNGFKEMVANFASISKSNNSKEMFDLLKNIVGEEFFNMLSQFYYDNIMTLNTLEKEESKNL